MRDMKGPTPSMTLRIAWILSARDKLRVSATNCITSDQREEDNDRARQIQEKGTPSTFRLFTRCKKLCG